MIIIRGLTITIDAIEIVLPDGVEPPRAGAAERARAVAPQTGRPGPVFKGSRPNPVAGASDSPSPTYESGKAGLAPASDESSGSTDGRAGVVNAEYAHLSAAAGVESRPEDTILSEGPSGQFFAENANNSGSEAHGIAALAQQSDGNEGGGHVDHQDGQPDALTDDESPAAGEKAVSPAGGNDASVTDEAEVTLMVPPPTVLADPDVMALRLASIGTQVPPAPVEPPVELALVRPPVEEDTLDIPPFLDRRQERIHG